MRQGSRDSSLKPLIRPAGKDDLPALLDLENISFKEETFHKAQLRYLLLKARSHVLVAERKGEIIGSIIILLRPSISNIRIYSLNVHPTCRRVGIGSMLMDAAEKFAKENGFGNITLETGVENLAAQGLYESKGFSVDKQLKNYYKNGEDAFHFIKKL
jgi:ribosomal-protein-alanine N-acetyltransferase